MSKIEKPKTLYPHPFSKAYWRDAALELKDTRMLVFAALMIAVRVALKLVSIPIAPGLNINTAFLANALGAMVFGPVMAAICAVATDILGFLVKPDGIYFLPFMLTEIAGSVFFALFLYRAKVNPVRVMLSRFCICFFVNVVIQTPIYIWYYALFMNGQTYALTIPGIIKNLFMFPIESVVLTFFLSVMLPITNRAGLTYTGLGAKEALKFTRLQSAVLVLLFVVGLGSSYHYLNYYYDTTNLITKSVGNQRYEANTTVTQGLLDATDEYDDLTLVTTITKSKKVFMSPETTYDAIIFVVDPATLEVAEDGTASEQWIAYCADMEADEKYDAPVCANQDEMLTFLCGQSKTPALKAATAGIMTQVGTVHIVMNDKTGEVLSFEITPAEAK